ncbi:MAG TPA: alpha/beta fold hydrolase [Steroidobacteraceae bacterium]|nr:alpha/beta fold hydrolase [Steroidobacteraceae bacterium]
MRSERLSIEGPTGPLEAIAEEAHGAPRPCYAVLCHPHPLYGGTMDNKVVTTLGRALNAGGIATLRFNFRGVGQSAGTFDGGLGETRDAAAVADYGAERWPDRRLVLGGFSFGAFVALRLTQERDTARLITIAPPVDRFDFSALAVPRCPWLIVQGDADEIVDPRSVFTWVKTLDPQPKLVIAPGVGHFFHGHLKELKDAVSDALRSG